MRKIFGIFIVEISNMENEIIKPKRPKESNTDKLKEKHTKTYNEFKLNSIKQRKNIKSETGEGRKDIKLVLFLIAVSRNSAGLEKGWRYI